jgi:hypothetical protein
MDVKTVNDYISYLKINNYSIDCEETLMIEIMQEELAFTKDDMQKVFAQYDKLLSFFLTQQIKLENYEHCANIRDFRLWLKKMNILLDNFYLHEDNEEL